MPWLIPMAIGAGVGALKYGAIDAPRAKHSRELAAATALGSPWTGLQAGEVKEADLLSNMLGTGMSAAQFAQGQKEAEINQSLAEKYGNYLDKGPGVLSPGIQGFKGSLGVKIPDFKAGLSPWDVKSLQPEYPAAPPWGRLNSDSRSLI